MGRAPRRAARGAARPALPERISLNDPPVAVRIAPSDRARRFTLRLTAEGEAVLTVPPGPEEAEIRGFLTRHAGWLAAARARLPEPLRVAPGMLLPVDGVPCRLVEGTGHRAALEDGRLVLPAGAAPGPATAAWLKRRAKARMVPLAEDFAARLGREISGIAFRDTRSRWGSCSARRRLSFSWRLAMAPEAVQTYLAAHEAAHLVEMNHSPRYWAVLASILPEHARARDWLKREGRALHRYRFD
ncbi:SprT family zinc-dependent metalloprotease [Paralimibaculum aggregatum]|uniref:SprT family zinc-dependent metalloprotease n=1 Tax=Paralimibaculum aggregatum TaxID=3036245 RepID=A0ABQ6LTE0_9RHOB|nr:SprT family zinc-dependent metalloprotease [Limibaculum sp. NKW23]GMG85359.1 SprT family zinc-dependent metalloprotease [Limibaculum sp. NKW23]